MNNKNKAMIRRGLAILTAPILLALLVVVYVVGAAFFAVVAAAKAIATVASELRITKELVNGNHKNMKGPFRWWGNLWSGLPMFLTRAELRDRERKLWDELNAERRSKKEYTETQEDRVKVEPSENK